MTQYYHSDLVWGMTFQPSDLWFTETFRGCEHPELPEANYCPVCGSRIWCEKKRRAEPVFKDPSIVTLQFPDPASSKNKDTSWRPGLQHELMRAIDELFIDEDKKEDGTIVMFGKKLQAGLDGSVQIPSLAEQEALSQDILEALTQAGVTPTPLTPLGLHQVRKPIRCDCCDHY